METEIDVENLDGTLVDGMYVLRQCGEKVWESITRRARRIKTIATEWLHQRAEAMLRIAKRIFTKAY